jgi:hypothetical protein
MTRILTLFVFFLALCGTAAAQCSFSNPTACGSPGFNNVAVGGNASIGGTLGVTGTAAFSGAGTGLMVVNNASIGGNLTVGSLTLSSLNNTPIGNITPSTGAFTTLTASGAATFNTTLGVTGFSTLTGGIKSNSLDSIGSTFTLGGTSATAINVGNSGSNTTLAGTLTLATSTTGAATQTFTNSPCSGLTSERWVPVAITGQTGTWYVPACQ